MEPTNDPELNNLLREWRAPALPESLEHRVLRRQGSWWRFLLRGSIRVPVPVVCSVAVLMAVAGWQLAKPAGSSGHCTAVNMDRSIAAAQPDEMGAGPSKASTLACAADSHC
jgi:hypothetical protein